MVRFSVCGEKSAGHLHYPGQYTALAPPCQRVSPWVTVQLRVGKGEGWRKWGNSRDLGVRKLSNWLLEAAPLATRREGMIRLRFHIPIVGTEPPSVQNWPCCRTGVIRHQKGHRGLTDI